MRMHHPTLPETLLAPVEVTAQAFEVCWSQPQPPHRTEGWKVWPPELEPYADALAAALTASGGDRDRTIRVLARTVGQDTAVSIFDNLIPPVKPVTKRKEKPNA